jgi:hypothetical protein
MAARIISSALTFHCARVTGSLTAKFSQHLFNFDVKQVCAVLRILPNGVAVMPFEGNPVENDSKDYQKNKGAHFKDRLSD